MYPTLFEVGLTYCDWNFTITNEFWDDRLVTVYHNDTKPLNPGKDMFTFRWGPATTASDQQLV